MSKQYRDAITGQYVTEDYAKRNPKTTVSETVKPKSPDQSKLKNNFDF